MTIAPLAGAMSDRIGEKPLLATGLFLQAVGLAWLGLVATPHVAYTSLLAPLIVAGVGVSLAIPAAQNSVMSAASMEALGKAAGINSMMRELGGVFGLAVVVATFAGAGGYASAQVFTNGFGPAVGVAAGLSAVGALVSLALPGRRHAAERFASPVTVAEAGSPS
jgi:MFS family permease